jgi:hypothetical protein
MHMTHGQTVRRQRDPPAGDFPGSWSSRLMASDSRCNGHVLSRSDRDGSAAGGAGSHGETTGGQPAGATLGQMTQALGVSPDRAVGRRVRTMPAPAGRVRGQADRSWSDLTFRTSW